MTATRSSTTRRLSPRNPTSCSRSQRGKDSLDAEAVYLHPAFALTPVAANKTFISMDGLYLLGFGPRTAAAARDLSIKLYPTLAPQAEKVCSGGADGQLPAMTVLTGSGTKRHSGYALRPPASLTLACLLIALAGAALIALTMGAAGIPLGATARRARPVARRLSRPQSRARPARAVVDPDSADRCRRHGRRPARGVRRHHAGAVSKSPRRSRAGRRFLRRRVCGSGCDRLHRQPASARASASCRINCCRSQPSQARW